MGDGSDKTAYNPYEHRDVAVPLSNLDAFISLLKCVIGTGILAMPLAFLYSGIAGGSVLTVISTIVLIYGMHLMISNMVESGRRMQQGYVTLPETMAFSFSEGPGWCRYLSKAAGFFVDFVLGFSHYGVCVVYIVFVAENWKQLLDHYVRVIDLRLLILIVGLTLLPLFLIRHLKYLVPFNMIANVLMYTGFMVIFYYLFQGLPSLSKRNMFSDPALLPLFFGIVLFAVTSVGVMLAIESKMAKPGEFLGMWGVLNRAVIFIIITNVAFGVIGYWRYGPETGASITLNLPTDCIGSQFTKFAIAMAIYLTFPLSGYVTIDIILNHYILKDRELKHPHVIEYIMRVIFVIVGTLNAVAFPNLGPLLALVGAFTISLLNLIFPACIDLCLLYKYTYGVGKWKLWKNLLLIIIGLIILLYGSYSAIVDMIKVYGGKKTNTTAAPNETTVATTTAAPA